MLLPSYCGSCGKEWNAQWKFCKFCGAKSSHGQPVQAQVQDIPEAKNPIVPKEKKVPNKWFLKIDSKESAKKAVAQAYVVAYVIATITMIFALISLAMGESIGGIDAWAMFDALLFALVGIGIQFYSRAAAVAGLALFILEKMYMISEGQTNGMGLFIALAFMVGLINGVRGTYAYQRFQNAEHAA